MAELTPYYLANGIDLNNLYSSESARLFARSTLTSAKQLFNGVRESLVTGNENIFTNAYIQYSGNRPQTIGNNHGGERFEVLQRMITSLVGDRAVAGVQMRILENLGRRLQSSPNLTNATYNFKTVAARLLFENGLAYTYSGSKRVVAAVNNTTNELLHMHLVYARPTHLIVSSNVPFIHSRAGGPPQIATTSVRLSPQNAGSYRLHIPAQGGYVFEIVANSLYTLDAGVDYEIANDGYNRAKINGLLPRGVFEDLDEFYVSCLWANPAQEALCSIFAMCCQSYELTSRALSIN